MNVYEIYVEKKPDFAYEAASVAADLRLGLQIKNISRVRIINRYLAENISKQDFETAKQTIFSEPPVDIIYDFFPSLETGGVSEKIMYFASEFHPGQFDQRADSCEQCISLATGKERPKVHSSKIYVIYADISDDDFKRIKSWLINPVECREASLEKPATLFADYPKPDDVKILTDFTLLSDSKLEELRVSHNLAMDFSDISFCRDYFRDEEKRDPTITEIKVLDTYWSDHCRHTTFLTELTDVQIDDVHIKKSYENFLSVKASLGRNDKPVTLMEIATIGAKYLKSKGLLQDLDESQEINACSVKIKVDVSGKDEDWLLMFKNETHNHPTEIEPFGGAATCLGGAIRDPLSGRSFVYQAMRVTGAADPLKGVALAGKLPQRKICKTAASGYSSYGNQIGLSTGLVQEIYHDGYAAKRMEIGAVIGAAPVKNVRREEPLCGDKIILLGGRTGRDGIGGATGSSKTHTSESLETCGADVQKGNAPEERKLQRLFRNPDVTRLIKRCNDFGAGGVCVSVGELSDGIVIDLDKITKKYEGLDGTELAISESQERMSVVIDKNDIDKFFKLSAGENLEATVIADVTDNNRMIMKWKEKEIVNLKREFLNSNGAKKYAKAYIKNNNTRRYSVNNNIFDNEEKLIEFSGSLNICSQKGLTDRFDSCIGAAAVSAPFGGKYQLTPVQTMAAKIPVLKDNNSDFSADTKTCSLMSYGFDPFITQADPYNGAVFSVVHSIAKIVAAGGKRSKCWISFQEYFERLRDDPVRWGKPLSALLGALDAQIGLETAAIGGKDSMSGSFETKDFNIDVPPTLVSFAVSTADIDNIITPEFKKADSNIFLLKPPLSFYEDYDFSSLCKYFDMIENLISKRKIISAWATGAGGTAEAVIKMCFGNRLGFSSDIDLSAESGFCGIVAEISNDECEIWNKALNDNYSFLCVKYLGITTSHYLLKTKSVEMLFYRLQFVWESALDPVYPYLIKQKDITETFKYTSNNQNKKKYKLQPLLNKKPKFLIPVFPGTNSEYDSARAVEKAGGAANIFVIRNLNASDIAQSVKEFIKELKDCNILFIPGGFSGGDEPDGSGKFITAFLRNNFISQAVMDLLQNKDGLILGICNGFQALIKLGLVPYGEIRNMSAASPTLTYNTIGRHQCVLVNTKIVSNKSPWLSHFEAGAQYIVPVSHGEGRFIADNNTIKELAANGQIATQYADFEGRTSQDIRFNPNNSCYSIEGITSPDGRVFGRMAHNERYDDGIYKNIPGIKKMDIFTGAVNYFK